MNAAVINDIDMIWHAAVCVPREEWKAARSFRRLGLEVRYPWLERKPVRQGKRNPFAQREAEKRAALADDPERLGKPLFPGYVFVGRYADQSLYGVRELPGVSTLLYVSGRPLVVPGGIMRAVSGWCEDTGQVVIDRLPLEVQRDVFGVGLKACPFDVGDVVVVEDGPFASFSGEIEAIDDPATVRILLGIFGRMTSTTVATNKLSLLKAKDEGLAPVGRVKHPFART